MYVSMVYGTVWEELSFKGLQSLVKVQNLKGEKGTVNLSQIKYTSRWP